MKPNFLSNKKIAVLNDDEDIPIKKCKFNYCLCFLIICILIPTFLSSCSYKNTLLFLNWGEYINDDLVTEFEKQYHCKVIVDIAESNELFYAKLKSGTTSYDLTCPSDYMIEKMYIKGLIQPIDFTKIPNYKEDAFISTLLDLEAEMAKKNSDINNYHVPYFWGTFGLMYNKNKKGLKEALEDEKTGGWNAYFTGENLPSNTKTGMYNVPRFSYAAAMLYNGLSPNEYSNQNIKLFEETLSIKKFNEWGTDTLKKGIESGNLDLSFVYTGDCLDMAYVKIADGVSLEDLSFDLFVPSKTIMHMDSLVIPKNARNKELAYKFINFMLDPYNAYLNAGVVGYCTPLVESYKMIVNKVGITESSSEDDIFWYENWAKCVSKYYPMNEDGSMNLNGVVLSYFDKEELTTIDNIVNKIKSR